MRDNQRGDSSDTINGIIEKADDRIDTRRERIYIYIYITWKGDEMR